jgi:methionine synthase II (cobalamin-independent)
VIRTTPPFRADHVGSLLRPPALKEARLRRERAEISAEGKTVVLGIVSSKTGGLESAEHLERRIAEAAR